MVDLGIFVSQIKNHYADIKKMKQRPQRKYGTSIVKIVCQQQEKAQNARYKNQTNTEV